jgi:pimeloyl-ACP methyl ester carboxylesterase
MTDFVTTQQGDRIAYDFRGEGPGLIFVAGAGPYRAVDSITTETAERAADQGLTTIVYDRIGRGESPAEGPITLDREFAALSALIEVAGGKAVLCGHSSGCSISLAAASAGLPVAGLALWEAPLAPGNAEWAAEVIRRLDANELLGALEYYMKDMPPEWLEGARRSPAFPQMVAQVVAQRPDAESLAWADSAPYSEVFSGIRIPTVAMVGAQTFPLMHEAADAIVGAISGATQLVMPGANHSWEPVPMAAELVAFTKAAFAAA